MAQTKSVFNLKICGVNVRLLLCLWVFFRLEMRLVMSILSLHNNRVTAVPVGYLYSDTPALSPLLLTYACPHCQETQRPCGMRCASADEGEIEGPTYVSCVSPGFWGDLLLTQEWKPQIKVFVLTKDKWDFYFAQTVQDCVGLLKVSGKKKCLVLDTSNETCTWN